MKTGLEIGMLIENYEIDQLDNLLDIAFNNFWL